MTAAPLIDINTLLERTLGDRSLAKLLIGKFYEQMTVILQDMDTAASSENVKELQNLAHKLKGSSATICSAIIREKSLELEEFLKEKAFNNEQVTSYLYDLKQYHEQFSHVSLE
jgi:HPt (histidine-containing phosphotransfer) domain-containing protein